MRQIEIHIDPIPVDPDGLAEAQAIAGAVPLVLNGALIVDSKWVTDEVGTKLSRRIGILSAGNDLGITFTILGKSHDNLTLSEAVTGASAGTAESVGYFSEITSITASGAAAGNVSAGTVDEFSTQTIPVNVKHGDSDLVSLERFTDSINVTIEESYSRIQQTDSIEYTTGATSLQGVTSPSADFLTLHSSACRVIGNSYTTGAELRVIINSDIR